MTLVKFISLAMTFISISFPQTVFQNIIVSSSEDTIIVAYELWGGYNQESYFIEMDVSNDGGASFTIIPRLAKGDIGYGVKTGYGRKIWWEPLKEGIELVGEKFVFRLKLSVPGSSTMLEFVQLKGSTYILGDESKEGDFDERPVEVLIDDFEISKFEITNAQYSSFISDYGSDKVKSGQYEDEKMIYENEKGLKFLQGSWKPSIGYENFPVVGVTWYGAMEYCRFYKLRLPTEAEWEYAAREQGKKIKYANGREYANPREINFNVSSDSNSSGDSKINSSMLTQQSVGAYPPNVLGIFQMSGNVWEWCLDWYEYNYDPEKTINPTGPWLGKYKVIRGGSFYNSAQAVRTTERSFLAPHRYASDVGFRVARSLTKQTVD
ncbi:MAG: hypothetical protein D8M52_05465 [Chlorobi bacterium]|nr:hypothetical protein [Ignavibacteriota bacterium]MBL1161150.1 hypothetical protein [Chlorobiota bacterium]MBW7843508.1 SUMF1/EgtB/PvdO family nonheme iron enzyme [Ignavibacterium sp.]MCZ2085301.1 formylglycine-generating enzyme family protein [Flavobacteriales bacterium]HOJ06135.1 SUMF1/EgtB/PvdO family nonheme iron enzyme [Ignavibacteriaceae bacterium]